MAAINLNPIEKIINSYALTPTLPFDIKGILVGKEGKNIKVEKFLGDSRVLYSLRLKEEIDFQIGEEVLIDKNNILSIKIERERIEIDKIRTVEEIIKDLGLENSEETREGIKHLVDNEISVTKENIESFIMSKKYLKEIIENIDYDSYIKLLDRDVNLKEDSLQKIAEALWEINKEEDLSLKDILKLNRGLSYKEAEEISQKIFGRKMGKDVYDSIIALDKANMPINKENIEKVLEVIDKLQDLKYIDDQILIEFLEEDLPMSIEALYNFKHSYSLGILDVNFTSSIYEQFVIEKELSLEELLKLLKELNLEQNQENLILLRELLLAGVNLTRESFESLLNMKSTLKELVSLMNEENVVRLMEEGIDPLREDIYRLVDRLNDKSDFKPNMPIGDGRAILKEIEYIKNITSKELANLIQKGEDFNIENLKRIMETNPNIREGISGKAVQKAITLSNIFGTLGELDSNTIALAARRYSTISLDNLYNSQLELNRSNRSVEPISKAEENLIRQDYFHARNNTTFNLVRDSIKEGIELEHMALRDLNEYIHKKVHIYRESQRLVDQIRDLKGKEDILIPKIIKNGMNMSLYQLNNVNYLLYGSQGVGNVLDPLIRKQNHNKDIGHEIKLLEDKIKSFSLSLREGKGNTKEKYKELLESLKDLSQSFDSDQRNRNRHMKELEEYLKLQSQLSQDDLVLQLPIFTGEGYSNINLIIPNIKRGIDINNMVFHINLNTKNLGEIKLNLQVKEKKIGIYFQVEDEEKILSNQNILRDGFSRIGYVLEKIQPNIPSR